MTGSRHECLYFGVVCVEIIEHDMNGVLFKANNAGSLVESLKNILDTPALINEYAERGFLTFKDKFSEAVYQKKFKNTMLI